MQETVEIIFNLSMLIYVAGLMLTQGLGVKVSHLIEEFKKTKLIVYTLLANFIAVPLFALGLVTLLDVSKGTSIGIVLLSLSSGAVFIPKLVQTAKGNTDGALSLMLLLTVFTIFFMPLVVPLLFPQASISALEIASSLLFTMLLPLVLGVVFNTYKPSFTPKLKSFISKISNISLIFLILSFIYLYNHIIIENLNVIPLLIIFFLGSMAIGYFSAGANKSAKISFVVATGLRNPPISMLVATHYFSSEPIAGVISLLMVIIGLSFLFPLSIFIEKKKH